MNIAGDYMIYFVDFETKGLNGEITELAYAERKNDGIHVTTCDPRNILNIFEKLSDSGNNHVIFWHSFMPNYLSTKNYNALQALNGRFSCFMDFYAIFTGCSERMYTIANTTFELTKRPHRGCAATDCVDLLLCYERARNLLINKEGG